mgnify:CR=1 FL=1
MPKLRNEEDIILDQMLDENIGFNRYSQLDDYEKAYAVMPIYNEFLEAYKGRDKNKYGRLSFENYVSALTPEERYINELRTDKPSSSAKTWYENFGEDTDLMKRAALHFGKIYGLDYPGETPYYQDANNTYEQGE